MPGTHLLCWERAHPPGQTLAMVVLPRSLSGCGCVHIHMEETGLSTSPAPDQLGPQPSEPRQSPLQSPFLCSPHGNRDSKRQSDSRGHTARERCSGR